MPTVEELYTYLNQIAPFESAMSFDNVGVLVGDRQTRSELVLVALDATAAVLREAAQKEISVVITHHPVIFHPLKALETDSSPYLAARYGITVLSAHTNLDVAPGGVNDTLAEAAGVRPEKRFPEDCALVGCLEKSLDCESLARQLCENLQLSGLRYTDPGAVVSRVLVACGAGGSSVSLARKEGADAILTGEIKHHEILYANDHGIAVFDIGHFGSEKLIVPRLIRLLGERFPDTAFLRSETDDDGIFYRDGRSSYGT